MALSICINYVDRTTLSVAAPRLSTELGLDPKQMGVLLSCFFWTYALCQIPAGWLVARYDLRWVFGAAFLFWSGATFPPGFSSGFGILLASRLLLAIP